jgi:hypothetical protein
MIDVPRKLRINFQIFTLLGSGPRPRFSRVSSLDSKKRLVVPERILGGF